MKKILLSASVVFLSILLQAQVKQGTVTYERTARLRMNIAEAGSGEQTGFQTRTDKFELTFGNSQSLWKQEEKENEEIENIQSEGMQIRMMVAGSEDVLFNNFTNAKRIEQRVFLDKKFIIDDSIRPLKWKIGEETKSILNHECQKATAVSVSKRMTMDVDNGVMQRKEIDDTATITAWFTNTIPVPAGPAEFQGQLPGLILALDINNGRVVYKAIEISERADLSTIKEPTGKKRYTPETFRRERDKMMDEMQQNNRGGNRQIRIN